MWLSSRVENKVITIYTHMNDHVVLQVGKLRNLDNRRVAEFWRWKGRVNICMNGNEWFCKLYIVYFTFRDVMCEISYRQS